jgi:predicted aconitase
MESSVIRQLGAGARTNTRGAGTSAAMLPARSQTGGCTVTGRAAARTVDVRVPVESVLDWGMLGYFTGEVVQADSRPGGGDCHRTSSG